MAAKNFTDAALNKLERFPLDKQEDDFCLPPSANIALLVTQNTARTQQKNLREQFNRAAGETQLSIPKATQSSGLLDNETNISDGFSSSSLIHLSIFEVETYDKNPRRQHSVEFLAEIKESIRNIGVQNPVYVTKRPESRRYMLAAGGNTRLTMLKDLYAETKDQRFATIPCLYAKYTGELDVLAKHIIENEQREEMSFWDKAHGYVELKYALETKLNEPLSARRLADELLKLGIVIGFPRLSKFIYAIEKLSSLGSLAVYLSNARVDVIRPALNLLAEKYAPYAVHSLESIEAAVQLALSDYAYRMQQAKDLNVQDLILQIEADVTTRCRLPISRGQIMQNQLSTQEAIKEKAANLLVLDDSTFDETTLPSYKAPAVSVQDKIQEQPVKPSAPAINPVEKREVTPVENHKQAEEVRPSVIINQTQAESPALYRPIQVMSLPKEAHNLPELQALDAIPIQAQAFFDWQTPLQQSLELLVLRLLHYAEIGAVYQRCENMPLGFYVKIPALLSNEKESTGVALCKHDFHPFAYKIYWFLVYLTKQAEENSPFLPKSSCFYQSMQSDESWLRVQNKVIGSPLDTSSLFDWLAFTSVPFGALCFEILATARQINLIKIASPLPNTPVGRKG